MPLMRFLLPALLLMVPHAAAAAEQASGSGALALAALVGNVSPLIGPRDKTVR
jgi:hypothetical protein